MPFRVEPFVLFYESLALEAQGLYVESLENTSRRTTTNYRYYHYCTGRATPALST